MNQLIGIGGKAGSGKGTAAKSLVEYFNFKEINFADSLKEICAQILGIDSKYFYDVELKDKPFDKALLINPYHICAFLDEVGALLDDSFYEIEDDLIIDYSGMELKSPRHAMQVFGTDIGRNRIDNNLWLDIYEKRIENEKLVVCSDVRHKNEREKILQLEGELLLIKRPNLQEIEENNHESEKSLGSEDEYNTIVTNDSTVEAGLMASIRTWYRFSFLPRFNNDLLKK